MVAPLQVFRGFIALTVASLQPALTHLTSEKTFWAKFEWRFAVDERVERFRFRDVGWGAERDEVGRRTMGVSPVGFLGGEEEEEASAVLLPAPPSIPLRPTMNCIPTPHTPPSKPGWSSLYTLYPTQRDWNVDGGRDGNDLDGKEDLNPIQTYEGSGLILK